MIANIVFQFLIKGGPVMAPILICALVAVAVVGERSFWWLRESRRRDPKKLEQILAALENGDVPAAICAIISLLIFVFTDISTVVTTMRGHGARSTMWAASGSNQKLNSWRGLVANSGSLVCGLTLPPMITMPCVNSAK